MSRSRGKRANTKSTISREFGNHGIANMSFYFQEFKTGDYVDIKINSYVQKGMPYKFYHGKTGKIFNISRSSVGIQIKKQIGNRKILKKINIKSEHVKKSNSRIEFQNKIKCKDKIKKILKFKKKKSLFFVNKPFFGHQINYLCFKNFKILDPEPFSILI